jgi:uncharacterized membrane protein YphA (DoxX/SURF4 family)
METKSQFTAPLSLLQLALAVYFGISGLTYLLNYNSTIAAVTRFFGNDSTVLLVSAIAQLIVGIILFAGLFARIDKKYMFIAGLIIMILWGLNIAASYFADGLAKPDILTWLQGLSLQLIILAGLWAVTSNYS